MGTLSCTVPDTIAPLASKGYWVPAQSCLPAGWVGGAVVTSDYPIVAVGRPHVGAQVMTYNGFSSGSLTSYLPMLFKNSFGGSYDSAFYVQNVDTTHTATLSIKFYDNNGNLSCTLPDTVAPLASKGWWVPSESCLPAGLGGRRGGHLGLSHRVHRAHPCGRGSHLLQRLLRRWDEHVCADAVQEFLRRLV